MMGPFVALRSLPKPVGSVMHISDLIAFDFSLELVEEVV